MNNIFRILVVSLSVSLLSGCMTNLKKQERKAANLQNMVPCPAERPLSCSQDLAPACGILKDGSAWDYNSGCMACTRRVVIGYIPGQCKN